MPLARLLFGILIALRRVAGRRHRQINGIIRDPSGLVVAGAAIKATQTATGNVRNTTSGSDGGYVFPDLPIGAWSLEVGKAGFRTNVQDAIILHVGDAIPLNFTLQVGSPAKPSPYRRGRR